MADLFTRASKHLGEKVIEHRPASGGCIAQAYLIKSSEGQWYFIKTGKVPKGSFLKEAQGLHEIAKTGTIKTPKVIAAEEDFLLLEAIEPGEPQKSFWLTFARQLGDLHRSSADQYGFYEDGFLGTTPQPNTLSSSWVHFFREQRLQYQLSLASRKGYLTEELQQLGIELMSSLPELLAGGADEPPSLIHGDLWSGNYLINKEGEPVLIDPAAYYAHREAELAMGSLFGGFDPQFFESYDEYFPLSPGWKHRQEVYKLYHLLNHLNIFGNTYHSSVLQSLQTILK